MGENECVEFFTEGTLLQIHRGKKQITFLDV